MKADELPLANEARLVAAQPTPLALMQQVIAAGITPESVGVMERLVALDRDMKRDAAAVEYAGAFSRLQASIKNFKPTKAVPGKALADGTIPIKYTYLPYEEIMREVQPLAEREGLSISFSTDFADGRIIQTCTFQHIAGHSKDYKAFVRAGAGPYGATETQADGAAMTYAKRYALCNALNIVVERDTDGLDARNEGTPITHEQAQTLKEMCQEVGADVPAFLKYAGASKFEEIGSARYEGLFKALQKKRGGR
jgi:hypothetical protein